MTKHKLQQSADWDQTKIVMQNKLWQKKCNKPNYYNNNCYKTSCEKCRREKTQIVIKT